MNYEEKKFDEIKYLYDKAKGYKMLGDFGWGFSEQNVDLIKKITKEDGWTVIKVTDADPKQTNSYPRDYYFISDKYKCFVPVSKTHWDNDEFQNYLDRAIGKQRIFIVKLELTKNDSGRKTTQGLRLSARDSKNAEEKALDEIKTKKPFYIDFPPDEWTAKVLKVKPE